MQHLYFCRHGLSAHGQKGLLAGSTETPLVDEGRTQARAAGQQAKALAIDYIISSPQSRARETAEIIADAIGYPPANIEYNDLFVERHYGSLEGQPWKPVFSEHELRDAETVEAIGGRAGQAYEYLQNLPYDNILVVSHSSFGRALRHVVQPAIPHHGSPRIENAVIMELL